MNREKQLKELIEKAYLKDNELFQYQGDSLSLVFYDKTKSDLLQTSGFFHTPTLIKDGIAKILIEPEFFDETIADNEIVLKEIEHILFQSTRKVNYIKSFFPTLITFWFSWSILLQTYPFVLESLPFWLQVIGMILLTLFFYGPIAYLNFRIRVKDRLYGKQLSYFYNLITNKDFLKPYRKLRKSKRNSFLEIDVFRLRFKCLQNATVRSIMPLVFIFLLFTASITPYMIYTHDTLSGTFRQFKALLVADGLTPTITSTPYKHLDSIDNPTDDTLTICGDYWCEPNNFVSRDFYKKDFTLLTFPDLCPNEEERCHTLWVDPYILVGYITDEEDRYYIWDPETKTTIESFTSIDMGISTIPVLIITSITYDSSNHSFYFVSTTSVDDESINYLSRLDSDGNWTNIELSNFYYSLAFDNELYAIYTLDNDTLSQIDIYDPLLNKKETIEGEASYDSSNFFLHDGELFLVSNQVVYETVFHLDKDNKFKKVLSHSSFVGWLYYDNDVIVTNSTTMQSFQQFDMDFKTTSKGLLYSDFELKDYFDTYFYTLDNDILYAINSDKIYRFEYTDTIQRSISPSMIIPLAGYIILGLVLVINSLIIIDIKSNQKIIDIIDIEVTNT